MPDINNKSLFIGDKVQVVLPNNPDKKKYDAQTGEIVSTQPFGGGRIFELRFTAGLPNALFEGDELVKISDNSKPWLEEDYD